MSNNGLISVIIPVYNVESYLCACVESVIAQIDVTKEIILVDDGSTDSSGRICDKYAEQYPFIRTVHKNNSGLSGARNRGFEEASGDWIIFLDSDDVWADKDCLTKLLHYASSRNLDIVRFEYQAVNENLEFIEPRNYDKSALENQPLDNYQLVKYGIAGEWFAVLYLIRRSAITNLRFNEKTKFQEDIDFYCRLFAEKQLRCGYLNEKMYLYRKRTASITTTCRIENLKGSFDLCDVFYKSSRTTEDKRLSALYRYYSVMMYYWTLQTLAAEPYYTKRASIINELLLNRLHGRIMSRYKDAGIKLKYGIFIRPRPSLGVKLLHIKDNIRLLLS